MKNRVLLSFVFFGICSNSIAEDFPVNHTKSTMISVCNKAITPKIKIVFAIVASTKTEEKCIEVGKRISSLYTSLGYKCSGKNEKKSPYECNTYADISWNYDFKAGIEFDRLEFTSLDSIPHKIIYINKGSEKICQSDKLEIVKSGVKDASCFNRKENIYKDLKK